MTAPMTRAAALAEARARALADAIEAAARDELPAGVAVERIAGGIALSGAIRPLLLDTRVAALVALAKALVR